MLKSSIIFAVLIAVYATREHAATMTKKELALERSLQIDGIASGTVLPQGRVRSLTDNVDVSSTKDNPTLTPQCDLRPGKWPKILHLIWFGSRLPDSYVTLIVEEYQFLPLDEIIVWTSNILHKNHDDNIPERIRDQVPKETNNPFKAPVHVETLEQSTKIQPLPNWAQHAMRMELTWQDGCGPNFGAISDIARLWILHELGGMYADFDVLISPDYAHTKADQPTRQRMREEFESYFSGCYGFRVGRAPEIDIPIPVNSIMGTEARSIFITTYLQYVQSKYNQLPQGTAQKVMEVRGDPPSKGKIREFTESTTGPAAMWDGFWVAPRNADPPGFGWTQETILQESEWGYPIDFAVIFFNNSWLQHSGKHDFKENVLVNYRGVGCTVKDLACDGKVLIQPPTGPPQAVSSRDLRKIDFE